MARQQSSNSLQKKILFLCLFLMVFSSFLIAQTPEERAALVAIYNATNGPSWTNNTNWNTSEPVSTWYGVTVDDGHVTELRLYMNNLEGTIPSEIGDLAYLKKLFMHSNSISGEIPVEFFTLTNLELIWMNSNELSGNIPPAFENLVNLYYCSMYINNFEGTIPPELGNLTNLENLSFRDNNLTGTIPPELGNLSKLENLDLSRNSLTGTIPDELTDLSELSNIYLNYNSLHGDIPTGFWDLSKLRQVWLHENDFTGSIPPEISNLTNLQSINLEDNNFSGTIPSEIGNLTELTSINFSDNSFDGTLPKEIGNLINLKGLSVNDNSLDGTIPSELTKLTQLINLDLSDNSFSGPIPGNIGDLSNLEELNLSRNELNGPIPASIGSLVNLEELHMSFNELSGTIPTGIGNLTGLTELSLKGNDLTGSIPAEIGTLVNLVKLNLSENKLEGTIPSEIGNLTELDYLRLQENKLSGSIIPELVNLKKLRLLNLSSNSLEGNIPSFLGDMPALYWVYFENNELDGALPTEVLDLADLHYLYIQNNYFDFADLEGSFSDFDDIYLFKYKPQAKVGETQSIAKLTEESVAFTVSVSGSANQYQWFHDGDPINGATSDSYTISDIQMQDAGVYHAEVTNDIVTDLVIERNPITLSVSEAPDTEAPEITCPDDISLFCQYELPDYTDRVEVTDDNDPNPAITQSPGEGENLTDGMTVTMYATDASGNESSCSFTINLIEDTESPSIVCPYDQELRLNSTLPDYLDKVTVSDDCDGSPVVSQSPEAGITFTQDTTITITSEDASGNVSTCSFLVIVETDDEAPEIICPEGQYLTCDTEEIPDYTDLAEVTDEWDDDPEVTQSPVSGSEFVPGMTITLSAEDSAGNVSDCSFVINVSDDDEAPSISCIEDQEISPGETLPDYTSLVSTEDNCDQDLTVTQSPASGIMIEEETTITITVEDDSGNHNSCLFNVSIAPDTEAPEIECPDDQFITCRVDVIPNITGLINVTDNRDNNVTITQEPVEGSEYVDGMTVTITAEDESGNISTCSFTVSESDDLFANCPDDQVIEKGENCQAVLPDYLPQIELNNNCQFSYSLRQSPEAGTIISKPTTVTLIAEDSLGHEQTCSFEVTLQGGFSAEVDAGEDVTISQGGSHQLNASSASEGEFYWSPEGFLDNPEVRDPIATPQTSTTYTVEFINENGCMASDEITITVQGISITKGFSPDNDGVNDTWIISGIDQYPNNEVLIFNRRGNLVYEMNGYDNTEKVFDGVGNVNNETLSEGTYFYSINLSGNESPIQGFIVLKK